jgi:hypothetical protein
VKELELSLFRTPDGKLSSTSKPVVRDDDRIGARLLQVEMPRCEECGSSLELYGIYMMVCRKDDCPRAHIAHRVRLSEQSEDALRAMSYAHRMIREAQDADDDRGTGSS